MEKLNLFFKLAYKFSQKYLVQYLAELKNPFIYLIIGIALLLTIKLGAVFAILALLSIPFICYAIWRGFVVTYALIPCADDFIKAQSGYFSSYVKKINEKDFGLYITFVALMTIIIYLPTILSGFNIVKSLISSFSAGNVSMSSISELFQIFEILILNTIIAIPFLNYFLVVYYYKKRDESYFSLFLNCYRKLNAEGILIMLFVFFVFLILQSNTYLTPLALLFCPFGYSINTLWYQTRIK